MVLLRKQERLWTLANVASAVIGLICYALSSSFNHLFGKWNPWKITLYTHFSSITFLVAVLAKDWQKSSILTTLARKWQHFRLFRFRSVTTFLVMLSTTVFSFFSDRVAAGGAMKPDAYSVVSSVAFSAISLSLSRNVPFIFEELMYFFMGIFIAQTMKIKLVLGLSIGIVVSVFFVILHSLVDAHDPTEIVGIQDQHPQVEIDVASLRGSDENHAISNTTAAAPSTVRLERWRLVALGLNASRRFPYSLEREVLLKKIQAHEQVIRAAHLFKVTSESETVEPLLTPSNDDDKEEEEEEEKLQ